MPIEQNQTRVNELLREQQQLEAIRSNWESYWSDIARRVLPSANIFGRPLGGVAQAERRTEWIFDSTAPLALDRFAAAMEWVLFPRTQRWHKLVPVDPKQKDNRAIRAYLEEVTDILFAARYAPTPNFASQAHENMKGLGALGTAAMFTDEEVGVGLRYQAVPLQDLYFATNHAGIIDTVFRKFEFTAKQAVDRFGDNNPDVIKAAVQQSPHRNFNFLHAVKPNKSPEHGRGGYRGMAIESCYLAMEQRHIVEEGGYRTMPYACSRYTLGPRAIYGDSPAMIALADIKMQNEISRTDIESRQLANRPPLLAPDDEMRAWNIRPGALNYGGMSMEGKPLLAPLVTGIRPELAEEKMERLSRSINDSFLVTLFQILVENPQMTATEALLRAQEKGALLTPAMGRQHSEFLGPMIARELDILGHAGQFPPMPEELMMAGGQIKIEYSSPLNRLQRAEDGVGILRTIESLAPLAQAGHPEVFDLFDMEKTAREMAEINGVPAKIMLDADVIAKIQAQRKQAADMAALVNAAPQAAAAAKDISDARATALNNPPNQPGVGQ